MHFDSASSFTTQKKTWFPGSQPGTPHRARANLEREANGPLTTDAKFCYKYCGTVFFEPEAQHQLWQPSPEPRS